MRRIVYKGCTDPWKGHEWAFDGLKCQISHEMLLSLGIVHGEDEVWPLMKEILIQEFEAQGHEPLSDEEFEQMKADIKAVDKAEWL